MSPSAKKEKVKKEKEPKSDLPFSVLKRWFTELRQYLVESSKREIETPRTAVTEADYFYIGPYPESRRRRYDRADGIHKEVLTWLKERKEGVFAYPRKKVQSRISSRLENDPLPLLSVFIDNMHVDEVQIDGGGTEAVITGCLENPGKRLTVLEGDEVEALYGRPCFTHEECVQYFALSPKEKAALDQLHSLKSRVYFILQLGDFKARRRLAVCKMAISSRRAGKQ